MKPPTKMLSGTVVELLGRRHLLQLAHVHDRDAIAHRHRLDLVVRDVDRRDADAALSSFEISARIWTRSFASRLDSGSSIRNAAGWRTIDARPIAGLLALPTGERARLAVEERLEVEDPAASFTRSSISAFSLRRRMLKAMLS